MKNFTLSCIFIGCTTCALAAQDGNINLESDTIYPEVITPTRLRQSLQDVPASVTTISREQLFQYGITRIPDALRLVPGMQVTQISGNIFKINYHGTNGQEPRRLNILIDGVSAYHPGLAVINWGELPVAIEDISRIEITRGPDSASYGPNSMTAIINIITVHPQDAENFSMAGGLGTQKQRRAHSRVSMKLGETNASFSISSESDSGYDHLKADPTGNDSTKTNRLLFSADTKFSDSTNLLINGNYLDGFSAIPFTSAFETFPDKRIHDSYLSAKLKTNIDNHHQIQLHLSRSKNTTNQDWTACYPLAAYVPELFALYSSNPSYANAVAAGQIPTGGTPSDNILAARAITAIRSLGAAAGKPVCGIGNQNLTETRNDIELQDTYVFSPAFRSVFGVGARKNSAESETYLNGKRSVSLYRYFGHVEWKPNKNITFNSGLYSEKEEGRSSVLSPRIGINYHIADNQSVRVSYSKGTRNPDLVERQGNISYRLRPFVAIPGFTDMRFYQNAKGTESLKHETNRSYELGYLISIPYYGLIFDAKLFHEKLDSLISQSVTVANFPLNNNNSIDLRGLELQSSFAFSKTLIGFFGYTYLQSKNSTTQTERTQYSRHSGSLALSKKLTNGLIISGLYSGFSGDGVGESEFNKIDIVFSKDLTRHIFSRAKFTYVKPESVTYQRTSSIGYSQFQKNSQAYVEIGLRF